MWGIYILEHEWSTNGKSLDDYNNVKYSKSPKNALQDYRNKVTLFFCMYAQSYMFGVFAALLVKFIFI